MAKLRNAALYKTNKHVQEYVENVWMSCVERWAKAFRTQQVLNIVNTNNGVEAQNKHFKYDYLPRSVDKSVFGIVSRIVRPVKISIQTRQWQKKIANCAYHGEIGTLISNLVTIYYHLDNGKVDCKQFSKTFEITGITYRYWPIHDC